MPTVTRSSLPYDQTEWSFIKQHRSAGQDGRTRVTTYVDTTVLAVYYCPEPISLFAERTLRNLTSPMFSDLTMVELISVVSRKIREKTLSREEGACILPVRTRDYRVARSWLAQLQGTLRTLDALHLAVAESSGASTLTADNRLAAEAQALGLSVKLLTITLAANLDQKRPASTHRHRFATVTSRTLAGSPATTRYQVNQQPQ